MLLYEFFRLCWRQLRASPAAFCLTKPDNSTDLLHFSLVFLLRLEIFNSEGGSDDTNLFYNIIWVLFNPLSVFHSM